MQYKIGISCIGGGVGQSVVSSCRLSQLPLYTVGFDTNSFAYGAYDCDAFDYIPPVNTKDYISCLIEVCKSHAVDLIIPGLDDEILMYAQNADKFAAAGIKTITSGQELIKLCRDKEQMSVVLNPISNVFVSSYNRETLQNDIDSGEVTFPLIAKPRGGSASKGINIIHSQEDLAKISDDHIIQELAMPASSDPNYHYYNRQIKQNKNPQVAEISIQIVTDKCGSLLGKMASYNKLKDGIPIEVVPIEDERIWNVVDELIPHFLKLGLRGPLNIQGRLTEKGFKIFEMNPRFTGITGLRALMGFNEVEACIASWLDIRQTNTPLNLNRNRFGVRQTSSKTIPIERNDQVTRIHQEINASERPAPKNILITGASSELGRCVITNLLKTNYRVWAFDHDKEELNTLYSKKEVQLFDDIDLKSGMLSMGAVDVLVHLEFITPSCTDKQVAESLAFSSDLFTSAILHQIPAIINVSSQKIYSTNLPGEGDGNLDVLTKTAHNQAVYTAELMLKSAVRFNKQTKTTSLRLPPLTNKTPTLLPVEPIIEFIQQTLQGDNVQPSERFYTLEELDVRDAADAIISTLNTPANCWKPIYDIGVKVTCDLNSIASVVVQRLGYKTAGVNNSTSLNSDWYMENSRFSQDTGWTPHYGINNSIHSLCEYFQSRGEALRMSSR